MILKNYFYVKIRLYNINLMFLKSHEFSHALIYDIILTSILKS